MAELFTTTNLVAFLTLTVLEIVLGIDNVIFIAILSSKLPAHQQQRARTLGISLAVISRIILLLAIRWIMELTAPLFSLLGNSISGRDLILLIGGLFLIGKSTYEIHEKLEGAEHAHAGQSVATMASVLIQVMIIDLVFSLDSVITAVGISGELWVMIPAVIIAAVVMLVFAGAISSVIERHPTLKILALAFLILIGSLLVIEGWNSEVAHELHLKNYVYFAMAFSVVIELINIRVRKTAAVPVTLHKRPVAEPVAQPRRRKGKK
ncbi:MAG: TerC family protein [Caldilineaceae bacterium]|nr:TerC family protein [Caldilineaceae bacterium]MCB0138597.1 TerC family protein [Caldilineaceae bacterium]